MSNPGSSPYAPPGPVPPSPFVSGSSAAPPAPPGWDPRLSAPPLSAPPLSAPPLSYPPVAFVAPSAAQAGQLGAGYQGSPYLRTTLPGSRRPSRVWIPLLCIGLVLVLAIGAGVVALVGKLTAPVTFADLDGVVTVHVPRGWTDETGPNPGELDPDGRSAPSLVVVDDIGDTSIAVWIFPTVPRAELITSHQYSLADACPEEVTCVEDGPPSATVVDDRPSQTSLVRVTGGDEDDPYVLLLATILAPRHLVLVEVATYDESAATDLRALLDGVTVDR